MKVTNKDRFGNEITLDQLIRLWKKGIEKDDLLYEVKKHEVFLKNKDRRLMEQAHLRKVTKYKSR